METLSLKELADRVLRRNLPRNSMEIPKVSEGNYREREKLENFQSEVTEDQLVAFEERAAIMEYDGGLDRKEAERQAWCREICMLSFPSQWQMCERFKPKPCPKKEAA